jgi:hypothetical protein
MIKINKVYHRIDIYNVVVMVMSVELDKNN